MTPFQNALPNSPESRYTQAHIQARNCVERCIGLLKGRFLCLSKVLRYTPEKAGNIVNSCAILHNICLAGRLEIDIEMLPPDEDNPQVYNDHVEANREGHVSRRNLIARYFRNN